MNGAMVALASACGHHALRLYFFSALSGPAYEKGSTLVPLHKDTRSSAITGSSLFSPWFSVRHVLRVGAPHVCFVAMGAVVLLLKHAVLVGEFGFQRHHAEDIHPNLPSVGACQAGFDRDTLLRHAGVFAFVDVEAKATEMDEPV